MGNYGEYFILGPLVNSFLLSTGPTVIPMQIAASGWETRAFTYSLTGVEIDVTMQLSSAIWQGVSKDEWQIRYDLYRQWTIETAEKSNLMALLCEETIIAHTQAMLLMPVFAHVLANRVLWETLNILNIATLGLFAIIIVPIMMALDFEYFLMRIAAASAMSIYDAASDAIISRLPQFDKPPRISLLNIPGLSLDGPEISSVAATAAISVVPAINIRGTLPKPKPAVTKPQTPISQSSEEAVNTVNPDLYVTLPSPASPAQASVQNSTTSTGATTASSPIPFTRASIKMPAKRRNEDNSATFSPTLTFPQALRGTGKDLLTQGLYANANITQNVQGDATMGMVLEKEIKTEENYTPPIEEYIGFNENEEPLTIFLTLNTG